MSAATLPAGRAGDQASEALGREVVAHLDRQIASTRSLLEVVLEQGASIRARDVQAVVRSAGILRGEMERRELLEEQRGELLHRCSERLGVPPEAVTLTALRDLLSPTAAEVAGERSAELKGLLAELQREHTVNRALMQVELGFLDHLLGMLSLDGVNGYDPRGSSTSISRPRPAGGWAGSPHVLDLRA